MTVTYAGSTWGLVSVLPQPLALVWSLGLPQPTVGRELCRCSPIKFPTTCCCQSSASKGAGVEAGILHPVHPPPEWPCHPLHRFCARCQEVLWAWPGQAFLRALRSLFLTCQRTLPTHVLSCLIESMASHSSGSVLICAGWEIDVLWGNGTTFLVLPVGSSTIFSAYNRGAVDHEKDHILGIGLQPKDFKGRCCGKMRLEDVSFYICATKFQGVNLTWPENQLSFTFSFTLRERLALRATETEHSNSLWESLENCIHRQLRIMQRHKEQYNQH